MERFILRDTSWGALCFCLLLMRFPWEVGNLYVAVYRKTSTLVQYSYYGIYFLYLSTPFVELDSLKTMPFYHHGALTLEKGIFRCDGKVKKKTWPIMHGILNVIHMSSTFNMSNVTEIVYVDIHIVGKNQWVTLFIIHMLESAHVYIWNPSFTSELRCIVKQ